jgi:acetate kinase
MAANSVLVLNAGSSSLKWVVLDAQTEDVQQQGTATWEGTEGGRHAAEVAGALKEVRDVQAVGHRVVHGGARFQHAVRIDAAVREGIQALADLAPLHNPAALAGIDAAQERFGPDVPQVAAFDTAFHASLPEAAATYALPWAWTEQWGLRRFGFHGLSVQYAAERTSELLGRQPERLVVCHLGAGCSASAVLRGQSVDTSMGFTPLEGLMMVRRSGSVDPGLMLHLLRRQGISAEELDRGLNEQSGLAGVSGVSADLRQVLAAAEGGQPRSRLAVDMFVHRVVSTVGGLVAVLHGLDALVFTGGIGEHSPVIRAQVAAALGFLGVRLEPSANAHNTPDAVISAPDSPIQTLVITAREDLAVLREVRRVLGWA